MKRTMFAILLFAAMASTAGAQGRYQDGYYDDRPPVDRGAESVNFGYADVLRADPVFEYIRTPRPREECYDERVVRREGGDGTAGAVLGAIVGGALGNQVGKGDGRDAATVAGAVIGGAIGHNAARGNGRTYEDVQRRCRIVDGYVEERQVIGYDVEYRYRGEVYMSRLDYNPGEKLRVRVSVTPAD